jgi:hypothetical protein
MVSVTVCFSANHLAQNSRQYGDMPGGGRVLADGDMHNIQILLNRKSYIDSHNIQILLNRKSYII